MNRLSPEAARLFQLAREADNPDAAEVDRVGRALSRRVAAGGALATSAALLGFSARATAALPVTKLVVAVAVVGAMSTSGYYVMHSRNHPMTNGSNLVVSSSVAPRPRASVVPSALPSEPAASTSNVASPSAASPNAPLRAAPRVAPAAPRTETADQLQAETADLHQAQAALWSGNAALALGLLNAQDGKYRSGLLQQERSAARVLALCQSGNVTDARAESAQFEKRWPNSPLAIRVRSACAAPGKP